MLRTLVRWSQTLLSLTILIGILSGTARAELAPTEYDEAFSTMRELLTRKQAREFLKSVFSSELTLAPEVKAQFGFPDDAIKDLSETQFLVLYEQNPALRTQIAQYLQEVPKDINPSDPDQSALRKSWRNRFRKAIKDAGVHQKFEQFNHPLEPYILKEKDGYRNLKLFVNHTRLSAGKTIPPDNLKQVVLDFIRSAKKEIQLNIFDFDLSDVADALIAQAKKGIKASVGIDAGVIEARPEVKAIYDRLTQGGVYTHAVDSVGLNHQKMMTKDWSIPDAGKVLFSSGNLTQSCIGPEGDLIGLPVKTPFSIPNANHMITMDSPVLSSLVHHEISKTIGPELMLRGREYPLGGTYRVGGPTPPAGKTATYLDIAFTPGGGLHNINRNIIAHVLDTTEGPVHMMLFAYSSDTVDAALLRRAAKEVKKAGKFKFLSVGDTPFAVQYWSGFLKMSGLSLDPKATPKKYTPIMDSPWKQTLGDAGFLEFKKNIRVAPPLYGTHSVLVSGTPTPVTSKIHHKIMASGPTAILGSSFNFSKGAETNQEQILVFHDPDLADQARGMVESISADSKNSVYAEAMRRNKYNQVTVTDELAVDRNEPLKPAARCAPAAAAALGRIF